MKSKLILFLVLGIFMMSFASAAITETLSFINETNETYGTYEVDSIMPNWLGGKGTSYVTLINNTDFCLIDCHAVLEFENEIATNMLDDIEFINGKGEDVSHLLNTINFQIEKTREIEKYNITYDSNCTMVEGNSTNETYQQCIPFVSSNETYYENESYWDSYNGEEVLEGKLKISAIKNPIYSMDWIITFRDKKLDEWAWWSSSWEYKREISIDENSGSSLTDYSVLLYINYTEDTSSHANSDFSDLRFLDSTELDELNYWIENKSDSNYAWIWVNIPSLTASSTETIYMYYGNSGASSNSDIETTFDYGYDISSTWNPAIQNNWEYPTDDPDNKFHVKYDLNCGTGYPAYTDGTYLTIKDRGECSYQYGYFSLNENVYERSIKAKVNYDFITLPGAYSMRLYTGTEFGGTQYSPYAYSVGSSGSNKLWEFKHNDSNAYFYEDSSLLGSISTSTETTLYWEQAMTYNSNSFDGYLEIDWVIVRDYISEEPTYSIGAEQSDSGAVIEQIFPTNGSFYNVKDLNFTYNISTSGSNFENTTLTIWNKTSNTVYLTNFSSLSGNTSQIINFTNSLHDGDYIWNAELCTDDNSCTQGSNITFTIDTTPFINFTSNTPTNDSSGLSDTVTIGADLTEDYFDTLTINVGGVEYNYTNATREVNFTLPQGETSYFAKVYTTTGKTNQTETRIYSVADYNVTLNSPSDEQSFFEQLTTFNATAQVDSPLYIENMSLWTNESGVWQRNQTTDAYMPNIGIVPLSYFGFNGDTTDDTENATALTTTTGISYSSGKVGTNSLNLQPNNYTREVTIGDIPINGSTELSISFWLNLDSIGSNMYLVASGDAVDDNEETITVTFDTQSVMTFKWTTPGVEPVICQQRTNASEFVGTWKHFAGTLGTNQCKIYIDGTLANSTEKNYNGTIIHEGNELHFGSLNGGYYFLDGQLDEFGFYEGELTQDQITFLYNDGDGVNYSQIISGDGLPKTEYTTTWDINSTNSFVWNVESCFSDGSGCYFADANYTRLFNNDEPLLNITSFSSPIDTLQDNQTLNLTWNVSDDNLNSCWYEYNSVNTTVTCLENTTTFNYVAGEDTIIMWANDTIGETNSSTATINYNVFYENYAYNTSSYETKTETFTVNTTTGLTLLEVNLEYNGTEYLATQNGTQYYVSRDISTNQTGNNSIRWKFTDNEGDYYSQYFYQNVEDINFSICGGGLTDVYLNISFKDEDDLSNINATVPTGTFTYYIGSGTETETYSYTSNDEEYYYSFCATPNVTFYVDNYLQYANTPTYPQRVWNPSVTEYTTNQTNQILYLLDSTGNEVIFQVISSASIAIPGVQVDAYRTIDSVLTLVDEGSTGSDGTVTLYLDSDYPHTINFTKDGYETATLSVTPTASSYTVTLTGESTEVLDYTEGIEYSIAPTNSSLVNDTSYTFSLTLTSDVHELDSFGFNLRLLNGTVITGDSSSVSGGTASINYNTGDVNRILMDYYWIINNTYTNQTHDWIVYNIQYSQWSIKSFGDNFRTYMDSGMFGMDNFGRNLIIFLIIFFSVGILGYKYGLNNPLFVTGLLFGIIFFLDVALGIIPDIALLNGNVIPNILTFVSGLMFALAVLREFTR